MQYGEMQDPEETRDTGNMNETEETRKPEAAEAVQDKAEDTSAEEAAEASEAGAEKPGTEEEHAGGADSAEEAPEDAEAEKAAAPDKAQAEWIDKYTRLYAEFDNYRKRTDKEKSQMFEMGAKDVIEKLLPIVDNFERALGTIEEADKEDAFTKGVEGIYRQIGKLFTDLDVREIEAEGQKFDPHFHNAVMTDTEGDAEEDTITQVLQKGYTYRGQVVRYAMVRVKK